jgi:glutathione synthase/RimK-type ligase-like ATP-grasp enzyme
MLHRILQRLSIGFYLIFFKKISQKSTKEFDYVIWSFPRGVQYFGSTQMIKEYAVRQALEKEGKTFKIEKTKNIGKYHNKKIFIFYSRFFPSYGFLDYTREMHAVIKQLEFQGNKVYPSSYEYNYWENKVWMHSNFIDKKISHPFSHTFTINNFSIVPKEFVFPFLVKRIHSAGGKDIYKIDSLERWNEICNMFSGEEVILQEFLDIRRDLRITFVGDKIVHHYWRINNSSVWKPTSTGFGSSVDFESFPEHWRNFLIQQFKSFNILTAGMDVAWKNDDLTTPPVILEISPSYQLNPLPINPQDFISYGIFKKKLDWGKTSYIKNYIDITFNIQHEIIHLFLSHNQ